jgi:hypothetical protein
MRNKMRKCYEFEFISDEIRQIFIEIILRDYKTEKKYPESIQELMQTEGEMVIKVEEYGVVKVKVYV